MLRLAKQRFVVILIIRGIVAMILAMYLSAAVPIMFGFRATTIVSGSMAPTLKPGDVVVFEPIKAESVNVGKILLFNSPDQVGHLRVHRLLVFRNDGYLVTKGDANAQADSSAVRAGDKLWVAVLRIPWVGLPAVWLLHRQYTTVVAFGASMVLLAIVAVFQVNPNRMAREASLII